MEYVLCFLKVIEHPLIHDIFMEYDDNHGGSPSNH